LTCAHTDQRPSFDAHGLMKLSAALNPEETRQRRDDFWGLPRRAARNQARRLIDVDSCLTGRLRPLSRTGTLGHLWSSTVRNAVCDLLGGDQHRECPRVLVALPEGGPASGCAIRCLALRFHTAAAPARPACRPGVRALSDVQPQGGGSAGRSNPAGDPALHQRPGHDGINRAPTVLADAYTTVLG
jgi:hypothetical protein